MRLLPLLVAIAQQRAAGYNATLSIDMVVSPAWGMAYIEPALGYVQLTLIAHYSPPDDVVMTVENRHATVPGTLRLIASTTSPSSTAIIQQNFSSTTVEIATNIMRGAMAKIPAVAPAAASVSISSVTSLAAVVFLGEASPPPPPNAPLPPRLPYACTVVCNGYCIRAIERSECPSIQYMWSIKSRHCSTAGLVVGDFCEGDDESNQACGANLDGANNCCSNYDPDNLDCTWDIFVIEAVAPPAPPPSLAPPLPSQPPPLPSQPPSPRPSTKRKKDGKKHPRPSGGQRRGQKRVVLTLTASGSVSDYSDTSSLRQGIATAAAVDRSLVTIAVAAASVIITATIAVPASTTAAAVQASLSSTLGTAAAASAALGVTIESAPIVAVAESEDSIDLGEQHNTSDDGLPTAAIIGMAVGAFVLLVGTLLGVGAYRGWLVPAQKNTVLAGAGTGDKSGVAQGEADKTPVKIMFA